MIARVLLVLLLATAWQQRPGWLGFGFTHHVAGKEQWLIVRLVLPHGPAEAAGLKAGDIITAIDGKPLHYRDSVELLESLARIHAHQGVTLTTIHEQKRTTRVLITTPMTDEQYERWKHNLEMAKARA